MSPKTEGGREWLPWALGRDGVRALGVVLAIAIQCGGCVEHSRQTSRYPEPENRWRPGTYVAESTTKWVFHGTDDVPTEHAPTDDEVVRQASREAESNGWKWPIRCTFVFKSGSDEEWAVEFDPLTLENLRASGLRFGDSDLTIFSER